MSGGRDKGKPGVSPLRKWTVTAKPARSLQRSRKRRRGLRARSGGHGSEPKASDAHQLYLMRGLMIAYEMSTSRLTRTNRPRETKSALQAG